MLGLSQQELARLCLISWTSLNAYERERARLSGRTRRAIMESLQASGVIFLLEERKGVGVRLARRDGMRPAQGATKALAHANLS